MWDGSVRGKIEFRHKDGSGNEMRVQAPQEEMWIVFCCSSREEA